MGSFFSRVLGRVKPFKIVEGADYQIVNNKAYREEREQREEERHGTHKRHKGAVLMAIMIVSGILTALLFRGLSEGIQSLAELRLHFLRDKLDAGHLGSAFGGHFLISVSMVLIACLLVIWQPAAGGGSIPELISQLNGAKPERLLDFSTGVAKALGMIFTVASGLAIAYEGPMIYMGAVIAVQTMHLFWFFLSGTRFRWAVEQCMTDLEKRNLIVYGSAVGITVAFRSPLGGILFVLEEAISFFDKKIIYRAYTANIVAYIVLELIYDGHWLDPSGFIEFDLEITCSSGAYVAEDMILYALMGVLFGYLGAFFNGILTRLFTLRGKFVMKMGWKRILDVVFVTFITSIVIVLFPAKWGCTSTSRLVEHLPDFDETFPSLNNSRVYPRKDICLNDEVWDFVRAHNLTAEFDADAVAGFLESRDLSTANCPPGFYNELRSLFQNTGTSVVDLLFTLGSYEMFSWQALLVFFVSYFFMVCIANSLSVPSGLVIPTIIVGGTMGRFLGVVVNALFKQPLGQRLVDPGLWAIIGAAGFWAGSGRITIAVAVIMLEVTGQFQALAPIAVTVIIAKLVGETVNHGIYHALIHLKGIPFLEDVPSKELRILSVKDVMRSPVSTVRVLESIHNIRVALSTTHNGFPVVDDTENGGTPRLVGLILRKHLRLLLPRGIDEDLAHQVKVDVTANMNETPAVIAPDYNLAEAFRMFRSLGLRHLVVVSPSHEVLGIVTRKDFMVDMRSRAYRAALKKHQNTEYAEAEVTLFNAANTECNTETETESDVDIRMLSLARDLAQSTEEPTDEDMLKKDLEVRVFGGEQ